MALTQCPECKEQISSTTRICPKCGFQVVSLKSAGMEKQKVGCLTVIIGWCAGAFLGNVIGGRDAMTLGGGVAFLAIMGGFFWMFIGGVQWFLGVISDK